MSDIFWDMSKASKAETGEILSNERGRSLNRQDKWLFLNEWMEPNRLSRWTSSSSRKLKMVGRQRGSSSKSKALKQAEGYPANDRSQER